MKHLNLFDVIAIEEAKEAPKEKCTHPVEKPTTTVWSGETAERLTMTCVACGRVRGRYPREAEND